MWKFENIYVHAEPNWIKLVILIPKMIFYDDYFYLATMWVNPQAEASTYILT